MKPSQLLSFERRLSRERTYWLAALEGAPEAPVLALDRQRPSRYDAAKTTVPVPLEEETAARAAALARHEPALGLALLVAAASAYVYRSTGQSDVIVGVPPPSDSPAAPFNHLVPVRRRVNGDESSRALLTGARLALAESYAHARYPFDRLLTLLAVPASPHRTPLGSLVASFDGFTDRRRLDGVMSDVVLSGDFTGDGLRVRLDYDSRLFDAATMALTASQLARTLEWLTAANRGALRGLSLMSPDESTRTVVAFNRTEREWPSIPIHTLVRKQAERTPAGTAVRAGARSLTYAELLARSARLAAALQARGVRPGDRVGIRIPHSIETVVAILGALEAGAVYVPLDPAHPPARIEAILESAGTRLVITADVMAAAADFAGEPQSVEVDAESLAYVIYTSGSTGVPKGVGISHRSLVNYISWANRVYAGNQPRDFALHSSLGFDLTVTSVFAPLVTGGAVVAYTGAAGEPALLEALHDDAVQVIKLTPSHLALLAEQSVLPRQLQVLIVGGEQLDAALAERVHEQSGGRVAIFNEYGPTEATVGCMIHRFDPSGTRRSAVPIGRPADNTAIYLLDERLEPVASGGVGELYIAGAGLAQRYFGQADATAERFVPNPFAPGQRMYRTGDLARWLPGDEIEFLGRNDDQVKVRGHRIDLHEVRRVIASHPRVRDCCVRHLSDDGGRSVIAAYYVARQPIDDESLRAFAREQLVEAAVPGAFVYLRRLPLTLNGKINLRALPGLGEIRRRTTRESTPPRTPTETGLAEIWRPLLGAEVIGVYDNFFELGGHSLIATQVVSRVREHFAVELPLRTLFESPTIAALAAHIDALGLRGAESDHISRAPRTAPLPLSFAQQRLWFLDQLDPASAVYNIVARIRITGTLDTDHLRASLNDIVARHEALRTIFVDDDGAPVQQIRERLELDLPVEEANDAASVDRLSAREAAIAFDLATGPLLRARLLREGPERHLLLLTLHHIIADGWSLGVLARELSALYSARAAGTSPSLPPLPVQYADFAVWQRRRIDGERLREGLGFWRAALDGVPLIELPTDRPRPAAQTYRGASLPIRLPGGLVQAVRRRSLELGATPYITLLTAYAAVLQRWTGQNDLAIGSPVANRTRPEIEGLIGFFVNTLVLRVRTAESITFRRLAAQVKDTVVSASAHQDIPFERLVDELRPERALSHHPLFQVMFGLQPSALPSLSAGGLHFDALTTDAGTAKFDLNLLLDDEGDDVSGVLEYSTDLFDTTTIVRFRSHFETLLAEALADPDRPLADLPIMSAAERHEVVTRFNATAADVGDRCMHEIVEAAVARTPDRIAVIFPGDPDVAVTFDELNRRANQLARHLRVHGAGPDVPIALCLERSIDMAVAVLAVLKAGSAYVPLDPTYPRDRLSRMIEDAAPPVLVAHRATRDRLPDHAGSRVVWLEDEHEAIAGQAEDDLSTGVTADNLLYIIYTSGSTGRPKGVALSHRALVNLIQWNLDTLAEGEGVLQFASLSFDASFHELFAAWASNRHVCMIPDAWRGDPPELFAYLERCRVETAILPVVVLHQWAEAAADARVLERFKHIVTTGEQLAITPAIVDLFRRLPRCRLHNHYGPSEAHVVTALTLPPAPDEWPVHPSIGAPIANNQIFILDGRRNPVPVGIVGELFIGGVGLARGYLHRPDLTAERFIPSPIPGRPGSRLYATGDLARWRADGTIDFLGRRDDQVKIRGFRVELGDVESVIARHPQVGRSIVTVHDGDAGRRLVAYVVPVSGESPTVAGLREFVRDLLPEYMVPSAFVVLESVALTPNGKIDRRALPPPALDVSGDAYVAPDGAAEEWLAGVWCRLLELPRVGRHDNFFHVGGHSLLATQLVSRIRRELEIPLPLKAVFEAPTIAGLVEALAHLTGGRDTLEVIADTVRSVETLTPDEVQTMLAETPEERV